MYKKEAKKQLLPLQTNQNAPREAPEPLIGDFPASTRAETRSVVSTTGRDCAYASLVSYDRSRPRNSARPAREVRSILTRKRRFKIYEKNLEAIFLPFWLKFSFVIHLNRGLVELI